MNQKLFLLFLAVLTFENAAAQIFRYRLSGNSGVFVTEPGDKELQHPRADELSHPGSSDFKPQYRIGAELELLVPLTTDFEVGLELDYSNLSGKTQTAPLYNFFLSRYNPMPDTYKYPDEALVYNTTLLNILGTARFYILPLDEHLNLFLKAFGGVSFVGTDFTFQDPTYGVRYDVGVLYSRGTLSNEKPKEAVPNLGGGLGATYRISDRLDLYFDGTASFLHSDIVNGVPNFDYIHNEGTESIQPTNSWSMVAQVSIGLIYSAIPDRKLNKGNFTRSRSFHKKLFWNRKQRPRPFSKRKRR